jgi:hypothetical protein
LAALIVGCVVAGGLMGSLLCALLGVFSKRDETTKVEGEEDEDALVPALSQLAVAEVQENSPSDASANGGLLQAKLESTSEPPPGFALDREPEGASERRLLAVSDGGSDIAGAGAIVVASAAEASDHEGKSDTVKSSGAHRRRRRRHPAPAPAPVLVQTRGLECEAEIGDFAIVSVPYESNEAEVQKWTAHVTSTSRAWSVSESSGTIQPGDSEFPFTLKFAPRKKGRSEAELHIAVGPLELTWALVGCGV